MMMLHIKGLALRTTKQTLRGQQKNTLPDKLSIRVHMYSGRNFTEFFSLSLAARYLVFGCAYLPFHITVIHVSGSVIPILIYTDVSASLRGGAMHGQ